GRASQGGSIGYARVFYINTDATPSTVLLHPVDSTTGAYPELGRLERGTDGALYGAAYYGGTGGYGTVFKLNPDGSGFIVLHSFDSSSGRYPFAGPGQGTDGELYGSAYSGGTGGY